MLSDGEYFGFESEGVKTGIKHLTQGYTLNQQRLESNSQALETALLLVRRTAESQALTLDAGRGLVDIITRYTHTFLWLQRYDEGQYR